MIQTTTTMYFLPAPVIAGLLPAYNLNSPMLEIKAQRAGRATTKARTQRVDRSNKKGIPRTFTAPVWKPIPGAVMVRGWGRGTIKGQLEVKDDTGAITHVWQIVERIGGGMRRGFKLEDIIVEVVQ